MELTIIDANFRSDKDWFFKLSNNDGDVAIIPAVEFYKKYGLKSPITKQHLDSLDKGMIADVEIEEVAGQRIVTKILKYHV